MSLSLSAAGTNISARPIRPQLRGQRGDPGPANPLWAETRCAGKLFRVTTREQLHSLVDDLSEAEAEAALARLTRERDSLSAWAASDERDATEDAWALSNAREAIREEPW